jgi:LytR_cpsA_psr family
VSRARRRWTIAAALVGVTAAVAVPLLVVFAARTLGDSTAGKLDVPSGTVEPLSAETPGALLVAADGKDVVGLTVFAVDPSGSGGAVVVVPVGSMATLDGFDRPTRLGNAYALGGLDAQVTGTEGLLGVTFSASAQVDEAALAALLAPVGPISVNLATAVSRGAASGSTEQVLPAGTQTITGAQAAAALFARRPNDSEINRLADQVEIWRGIADAAGRIAQPASDGAPSDAPGYLAALGAGKRSAQSLDVTQALDVVTNPDGIDLLQADSASTHLLMARLLPTAISPTNGGLRVRLVNRTGDEHALLDATARLLFTGANVVAVDDAAGRATVPGTSISYDSVLSQDRIEGLTLAVGPSAAAPAQARVDGVDVTIELGQEFESFVRQGVTSTGGVAPTSTGG